jgi:hypothetical protein
MRHRAFLFAESSILPDNKLVTIASSDVFHLGVLSSHVHTTWSLRAGGWLGAGNDSVYVKSRCFDPFPFPEAAEETKAEIRSIAEELDAHRKRCQAEHPGLTLTGMHNVLEALRAGVRPEALDPAQRAIFDQGLVLILKELHDRLDAAVLRAYGWPAGLTDEAILARLVALNREHAAEEAEGRVRWLRPRYQIPRFAPTAQKGRQLEAELVAAAGAMQKPALPADDMGQTAAVMAALASAAGPVDAAALAASFRQGRRVEPKIAAVLTALARMGFAASADNGRTFALRRAA